MHPDWTTFTRSITIRSSREILYNSFATRAGMEAWFLRSCDYKNSKGISMAAHEQAEAGNTYRWLWFGYGDDSDENGKILQANGSDLFEFSFNANGKNDMKVKVLLSEQENEWRVDLTQYNIPVDEQSKASYYVGCTEGWTFYLANLKSVMEGGIDLRNRNEAIKRVINS
jgi:uncharacterized protein YndB with AHSA1/START domain